LSKGTIRIYKAAINNFASIIGNLPLASYTPQHFDIYKAVRQKSFKIIRIKGGHKLDKENTVKPITINIELRTLRSFFNTAVRWRILDRSPFDVKLVSVPDSLPTFLTKEDFQKLLSIVEEGWFKEVIIFAVTTGLRRAELTNLKWTNVDLQRRLLKIESSPTFHTKSGRRRVIPLSDTACYLLRRKQHQEQNEYVFTLNGKKIHDNWITHLFKWYIRAAQFDNQKIHFHSLRHTFASWLVQDGTSLYVVKDFLGHADVKTTAIYSHLQPENLHSEVNKISISMN
jgi:integrase